MARGAFKEYVGKSKYKYVNTWLVGGILKYRAHINKFGGWVKFCDSEIEAAKAVDLKLIEQGKEPVNILVRKSV